MSAGTNKIIKYSYTWTEVLKYDKCPTFQLCSISPVFVTNANGDLNKWELYSASTINKIDTEICMIWLELRCLSENSSESAVSITVHLTKGENIVKTYQDQLNCKTKGSRSGKAYFVLNYNFNIAEYIDPHNRPVPSKKPYLSDFSLKIICDITFDLPTVSIYNCSTTSSVDHDFKKNSDSDKLSDVKIVAGGEEFPAHGLILSLRSKDFEARLRQKMLETSEITLKLKNIDADVIRDATIG